MLIIKILNFKLVIMQNIKIQKTLLVKDILKIGMKKFLQLKKLKIQYHGQMLLMISMVKKLLEHFMKKKLSKNKPKRIQDKKVIEK